MTKQQILDQLKAKEALADELARELESKEEAEAIADDEKIESTGEWLRTKEREKLSHFLSKVFNIIGFDEDSITESQLDYIKSLSNSIAVETKDRFIENKKGIRKSNYIEYKYA